MMLKITSACSMGCTHCISDCKPDGIHMQWPVLKKSIEYINRNNSFFLLVSGGEPTEHPDFFDMLQYILENVKKPTIVTLTTNGEKLHGEFADKLLKIEERYEYLAIQVTSVKEYYPKEIDTTHPIFKHERTELCTTIPNIYPQGRAAYNKLKWSSKGSKCVNLRIIPKQISLMGSKAHMYDITNELASHGLSCTPFIDPEGNIKLGESDLCPTCATIFNTDEEIMDKIMKFRCDKCKFINDTVLPLNVQMLLAL